jgi:hypothetical protein
VPYNDRGLFFSSIDFKLQPTRDLVSSEHDYTRDLMGGKKFKNISRSQVELPGNIMTDFNGRSRFAVEYLTTCAASGLKHCFFIVGFLFDENKINRHTARTMYDELFAIDQMGTCLQPLSLYAVHFDHLILPY